MPALALQQSLVTPSVAQLGSAVCQVEVPADVTHVSADITCEEYCSSNRVEDGSVAKAYVEGVQLALSGDLVSPAFGSQGTHALCLGASLLARCQYTRSARCVRMGCSLPLQSSGMSPLPQAITHRHSGISMTCIALMRRPHRDWACQVPHSRILGPGGTALLCQLPAGHLPHP